MDTTAPVRDDIKDITEEEFAHPTSTATSLQLVSPLQTSTEDTTIRTADSTTLWVNTFVRDMQRIQQSHRQFLEKSKRAQNFKPKPLPPSRHSRHPQQSSFFMTLLNADCRFGIYDAIIDDHTTIHMVKKYVPNGLLLSLSFTSLDLYHEIKAWSRRRPDLVRSPVFGLYNPYLTSIEFCFQTSTTRDFADLVGGYFVSDLLNPRPVPHIVRRVYGPAAAMRNRDRLEHWQSMMNAFDTSTVYWMLCIETRSDYVRAWPGLRFCELTKGDPRIKIGPHEEEGVSNQVVLGRDEHGDWEGARNGRVERLEKEGKVIWVDEWEGYIDKRPGVVKRSESKSSLEL